MCSEQLLFHCPACGVEYYGDLESEKGKLLKSLSDNEALSCPDCGDHRVLWKAKAPNT